MLAFVQAFAEGKQKFLILKIFNSFASNQNIIGVKYNE